MKRRIRVITKATTTGQVFSDVYNGWIKGDIISDDEINKLPVDSRNIINIERYSHEWRMRERYGNSPPFGKDVSQTQYIKLR